MLECFFSVQYEGRGDIFQNLSIWEEEKYRELQDIYNPWSITCFLNCGKLKPYWANTSSNGLISNLIQKGNRNTKMQFELLLSGQTIQSRIDEEMVFNRLEENEDAVWSLLLAGDTEAMNEYMTEVAESMFRSFDGGNKPSARTAPERFYHGFVLGLLVDLAGRYVVSSNRESGFGRYDVMLKPLNRDDDGIILEFKIYNPKKESSLEETVQAALDQIEEKNYEQMLLDDGIERDRIRKYGFAFRGKEVLIK